MEAISQLDEKLRRFKQIRGLRTSKIANTSLSSLCKLGTNSQKFSRIIPNLNNSVTFL